MIAAQKEPPSKRRYRLYVDESGSHTYKELEDPRKRYLGLTGCAMQTGYCTETFVPAFEGFKKRHFPEYYAHEPDEPLIFHRTDIMQRRGAFWRLKDENRKDEFNAGFLELLLNHHFGVFTVVVDKHEHQKKGGATAKHPYHVCLTALLELYCGYLNTYNGEGDVMAESRGGAEDTQLKVAYRNVYDSGTWYQRESFFQAALTSQELKLKPKTSNIAGLQLADLLAHPSKVDVLIDGGISGCTDGPYGAQIRAAIGGKYNRCPTKGIVAGFGKMLL